jgi:hypothetical protein
MEDGQTLLQWYATTLLWSRRIIAGSLGQLWYGKQMILSRILFTFPVSLLWQCWSSQLTTSSRHLEIILKSTMLCSYYADFLWIEFIVYAWIRLHCKWGLVSSNVYWNVDRVLFELVHQHLGEDHIISTLSREVFYCYIVVRCKSTAMFETQWNLA